MAATMQFAGCPGRPGEVDVTLDAGEATEARLHLTFMRNGVRVDGPAHICTPGRAWRRMAGTILRACGVWLVGRTVTVAGHRHEVAEVDLTCGGGTVTTTGKPLRCPWLFDCEIS